MYIRAKKKKNRFYTRETSGRALSRVIYNFLTDRIVSLGTHPPYFCLVLLVPSLHFLNS